MLKTYKITKKSLTKFKKRGLSEASIENLSRLEDQFFESSEIFFKRIESLPNAHEILENREFILKYTVGYFRLDKWIVHKTTREWIEALIFALVVATIVRTFLFAPFKVPSGSMIPTIQIGDHLFASMFTYGIPLPFLDKKLFAQPVERGDIIIFPYPRDPSIDYIKRAIGLEGDIIKIVQDKVYINGNFINEEYAYFDPKQYQSLQRMEIIGQDIVQASPVSNFGPVTVPKGKVFAMGDNRYNSADGRYWGFVDLNTIKGKGQMIYWSHDPRKSLFDWDSYHLNRMFSFLK